MKIFNPRPSTKVKVKRVLPGLARVRKEVPPPGGAFKDKLRESRKHAKEALRNELKRTARS
jgi:hypothetical protein